MKRFLLVVGVLACSSTPPKLGSLSVSGAPGSVAGQSFQMQVAALDTKGAPLDFVGTAEIDDATEPLAQPISFAAADHGKRSAQVTLKKAGPHTLTIVSGTVQATLPVAITAAAGSALQLASGDAQTGTAGSALAAPFAARVVDAFGNAVAGEPVSWKVFAGASALSAGSSTTGADGIATVTATLDKIAGAQQFQALYKAVTIPFSAIGRAGPATALVISGGNDQHGTAGSALLLSLRVRATDPYGNFALTAAPVWSAPISGDAAASQGTDAEGTASATATLGSATGPRTLVATLAGGAKATFDATTWQLVYTAPAAGGKVRLVANAASTPEVAVLDLVTSVPLTAFSAGMNLPLDLTRARADATSLVPGSALPPGTAPIAAGAALLATGPLKGVLVSVQTQKAAGNGATPSDSAVAAGAVLYTLRLHLRGSAATGAVFDGTSLPAAFRAAVRNKAGTNQAGSTDFLIGKLSVSP